MNLYIRSIGFSDMDSKQEREFIQSVLSQNIKDGKIVVSNIFNRAVVIVKISESTGVYIYGRLQEGGFIYEYYYPFVIGKHYAVDDEIVVERHTDKESYSVVCDEAKTGVTLIFYLQNIMDYMNYISDLNGFKPDMFIPDRRNDISLNEIKKRKVTLSALSLSGMILFPIKRNDKDLKKSFEAEKKRKKMIAAAKNGDEDAMEKLTIEDIDTYARISQRIVHEDIFSIVDSTFMPCGVECDQYSVLGEILELEKETNVYTKEIVYIMLLECNSLIFTLAVNEKDLIGEPAVGRRFKGQIWLQGSVKFRERNI